MTQPVLYIDKFEQDRVCVIVPTYNNAKSLGAVINDISAYTKNIIAVNDGSVDDTEKILGEFSFLHIISYKKNVGKGWALRQGLKRATDLGYLYAITLFQMEETPKPKSNLNASK